MFNSPNIFYAYYDKLDGLTESNPVLLYGYKVGKVERVTITNQKGRFILVKFTTKKEVLIPSDTRAKIINTDLLGAKAIELTLGLDKRNASSNDTLIGETELGLVESVSSVIDPIKQKAISLLTAIDNVMNDLQLYLGKGGKKDLTTIIEGIKNAFINLEHTTATLDNFMTSETSRLHLILGHIDNLSETLDNNKTDLDKLISNLGSISDSLKKAHIEVVIRELSSTIAQIDTIAQKINKGHGTLAEFVNNDTLYNNLEITTKSLNELLVDLKENPKRYINISVFGSSSEKKKDKKK